MLNPTKLSRGRNPARRGWPPRCSLPSAPHRHVAIAGEGGTSHIMPGANATLVDLPPTTPGWFFKPMYINYQGERLGDRPHGGRDRRQRNADANTLVLGGGYGLEQTVLGGAHYSVAAFLPYTWLNDLRRTPRRWAASRFRTACPASAT